MGSVYVAKYASLAMSKNKAVNERGEKGVILFVSSVAAEEGQRGQAAYSATKGAVNGMVCLWLVTWVSLASECWRLHLESFTHH